MAPFMNTASAAPRGTCEVILRNFDKIQRGKYLMNPIARAARMDQQTKYIWSVVQRLPHPVFASKGKLWSCGRQVHA